MKRIAFSLGSFVILVSAGTQQLPAAPTINSVANAASNITFNSPIAQGGIFVLKGRELGPANISIAPAAFQSTSLSGTSVAVTVGATTVAALMYYTSATQIAALLPSNTPTGGATFTVTYNGQTSNSIGHAIVRSNVGIFTLDSTGQGPGIVTFADYSLVSAAKAANCGAPLTACGAANPGDTLILWATGLGPVSGDDAAGAGLGQAMPGIPLKLWLGGVQAPVVYQGRSGCCIGEDQIAFTVPDGVPTGCAVPLIVQIGEGTNQISNSALMPVAKGSRNCTAANSLFDPAGISQAITAGPVTSGYIGLGKNRNNNSPGFQDVAEFSFIKLLSAKPGTQPFFVSWLDDLPLGTCAVRTERQAYDPPVGDVAPLDFGSGLTVKGPSGSVPVTGKPGEFNATLSEAGTFLVPGATYTVTGTGGADVGPFTATITLPASPALTSPMDGAVVARANGMTATWTGGDPDGSVEIHVSGATDNTFNLVRTAICSAPARAGTFTIPSYVLLAIPAGNFGGITISPKTASVPFTAKGLNIGFATTFQDGTGFGYGAGSGSFSLR